MAEPPFVAVDLEPIGQVRPTGETTARIDLDPDRFAGEGLRGIETFSHAIVVVHGDPPRWNDVTGAGDRFEWAGPAPAPLAVTTGRIVDATDRTIDLDGVHLDERHPVVDAKPYMREFGPFGPESQPFWLSEVDHDQGGQSNAP
ncbi:MAG: TrmO family methyltransferase domain-containing protein [Halococcoides sp.]